MVRETAPTQKFVAYEWVSTFAATLLSISDRPWVILLLMNLILLIVGCFMETIAAIAILVPVLLPVTVTLGVDPVHFGVVMGLT